MSANFTMARQAVRSKVFDAVAQEFGTWIEETVGEPLPAPGHENVLEALKDGIVLCKLINAIKPGTIPKFKATKSPFAAAENVNLFLGACEYLGVKKTDLFIPNDLIGDKNDPLKVFGALESLRVVASKIAVGGGGAEQKRGYNINDVRRRVVSGVPDGADYMKGADVPPSSAPSAAKQQNHSEPEVSAPLGHSSSRSGRSSLSSTSPRSALSLVDWGAPVTAKSTETSPTHASAPEVAQGSATPPTASLTKLPPQIDTAAAVAAPAKKEEVVIVAEPPKPKAAAVVVDAPQQQPKPVPVVVETPQQPKYVPIVEAPQQPKPVVVMEEVPAPRPVAVDEIVQPKLAQPKSFIVTEQPTKPASKPFPFVSAPKKEVQPLAINTKSRKSIDLGTFGTTDKDFDLEEDDLKAIADRDKDDQFLEQQNYLLEFEKTLERDFAVMNSTMEELEQMILPPIPDRPDAFKRGLLDLMESQNTPDFDGAGSPTDEAKLLPGTKCIAKYEFLARKEDELSFLKDDQILLLEAKMDNSWWFGQVRDKRGWFPSNRIEVLQATTSRAWFQLYNEKVKGHTKTKAAAPEDVSTVAASSVKPGYSQTMRPKLTMGANGPTYTTPGASAVSQGRSSSASAISTPIPKTPDTPTGSKGKSLKRESGSMTPVILQAEASTPLLWRDSVDANVYDMLSEMERKRQEVIYELIRTEKEYVRDLHLVVESFQKPLVTKKILTTVQAKSLFSNIENLVTVNEQFLKTLDETQRKDQVIKRIGDVFLNMSDFFKMYKPYCYNHPYSVTAYQMIKNGKYSKPFRRFEEEMFKRPECRLMELPSFLLKPVQRICKYPLLIKEILKATSAEHDDYDNLTKAYKVYEELMNVINEAARQGENERTIIEIQRRFTDKTEKFVSSNSHRAFLVEETVQVFEIEGSKKKLGQTLVIFVFSDILVLAKYEKDKPTEKFEVQQKLAIDEIACRPAPDMDGEASSVLQLVHRPHEIQTLTPWGIKGYLNVLLLAKDTAHRDSLIGKIEDASQKYTAQKKQDAADAAAVRPSTPQTAVSSKTATPTSPLASTGPTTPEVSEASSSGALREVTLPRQFTLPTPLLDVIQCHVIDCVRRGGVNSRFKRQSSTQGLLYMITVQRKPDDVPFNHEIYKSIDDFVDLHMSVMKKVAPLIKDEAEKKKLPTMPGSHMLTTEAIYKQAISELEAFLHKIVQLQHSFPVVKEILSTFLSFDAKADMMARGRSGSSLTSANGGGSASFESLLHSTDTLKISVTPNV